MYGDHRTDVAGNHEFASGSCGATSRASFPRLMFLSAEGLTHALLIHTPSMLSPHSVMGDLFVTAARNIQKR